MRVLVAVVGLWRAPWALERSLQRLRACNADAPLDVHVFTENATASDVRRIVPRATLHAHRWRGFLPRLQHAYALLDWTRWPHALVLRPDVELTRCFPIHKTCSTLGGVRVISGNILRRYIFHNRDWDFGYLVCRPDFFVHWVHANATLQPSAPRLPPDFTGCWNRTCGRPWRYGYMEAVLRAHETHRVPVGTLDRLGVLAVLRRGGVRG